MTLKDDLGLTPRVLYGMFGAVLAIAAIASAYHDWPLIQSGKAFWLPFVLINAFILPLSLLIVVWAVIGRHREWRIDARGIRIRVLSLTSWQKSLLVAPRDIIDIAVEDFPYEDKSGRSAHWIAVHLADGRVLKSPRMVDPMLAEAVRRELAGIAKQEQESP